MRIALDATAMPKRLAGAGYYSAELMSHIPQFDSSNEYIAWVGNGADELDQPSGTNWTTKHLNRSPLVRLLWQQLVFPRLLRSNRVDLLHSLHYSVPLYSSTPYVVTFHDMTFFLFPELHQRYRRLYFNMMMRGSARGARKIIAVSENTRQDIIRIFDVAPERVVTIHSGISSDFRKVTDTGEIEYVRSKYGLPSKYVLSVGLIEPRKNLSTLIRAFGRLDENDTAHSLVVVGDKGWMYEGVFDLAQQLERSKRIIFTGYVPRKDLAAIYSSADLFVYPSLYEGFGLPVLEAMACGTPVITSNLSALPEIAGDSAVLVSPRNEAEITEAILRVLSDRALHAELSSKGLQHSRLFSWDATAQKTIAVYRDAIANS